MRHDVIPAAEIICRAWLRYRDRQIFQVLVNVPNEFIVKLTLLGYHFIEKMHNGENKEKFSQGTFIR